jgi:hypothetical protein
MNSLFVTFLQELEEEAKHKKLEHLAQTYRKVRNFINLSRLVLREILSFSRFSLPQIPQS